MLRDCILHLFTAAEAIPMDDLENLDTIVNGNEAKRRDEEIVNVDTQNGLDINLTNQNGGLDINLSSLDVLEVEQRSSNGASRNPSSALQTHDTRYVFLLLSVP